MGRCSCTTPNSGSKGTCTAAQSALQWSGSDIPLSVGKSSTWSPEGRTTIMLGCKETASYSMYCCFGAFNAGGLLPAVPKPVALIYSLTSLSFCMRCIPSLGFLAESVFCISWIFLGYRECSSKKVVVFVDANISQMKLVIFWYILETFIESYWRALVSL